MNFPYFQYNTKGRFDDNNTRTVMTMPMVDDNEEDDDNDNDNGMVTTSDRRRRKRRDTGIDMLHTTSCPTSYQEGFFCLDCSVTLEAT